MSIFPHAGAEGGWVGLLTRDGAQYSAICRCVHRAERCSRQEQYRYRFKLVNDSFTPKKPAKSKPQGSNVG